MLKKWFAKMCRDAWNDANGPQVCVEKATVDGPGGLDMDQSLRFNVLNARGGTIVECRHYDRLNDRNKTNTHVIPEGENISEAIGHIVSLELLQKQ